MDEKNNMIHVHVISQGFKAGDKARITINNVPVRMGSNSCGHLRGLHIVVVNP